MNRLQIEIFEANEFLAKYGAFGRPPSKKYIKGLAVKVKL